MDEEVRSAHPLVVYVYRGTFDPLHINHEKIIEWCLSQPNTLKVVIHINYQPFDAQTTKQPAPWDTRYDIIQSALKDKAEIRPKESFDQTLESITRYNSDVEIIQVLGSDVLDQVSDKPQIKSYAQHIRSEDTISATYLHNKPLLTIPLYLPPISSTDIRKLFLAGKLNEVAKMLSRDALEEIKKTNVYSPLSLSIRDLQKRKFFISNPSAKKLMVNFGGNYFLEDKTQQFKGRSGDTIFSVIHNNKSVAIVKLFQSGEEACKKEVHNHRLMAQFAKTPLIYFTSDNLVCMKHIYGKPPESVDDYERIGIAYRTLHEKSLSHCEISCDSSKPFHHDHLSTLCTKIKDHDLSEKIAHVFEELLKRYVKPPKGCVIHGDAQPGNVLIKENEVVFIDFGKVKSNEDPARDVNQMISSIYWKAWHDQATGSEDVLILQERVKAFKNGYSYTIATPADQLWSFYWQVRCLMLTFENPELALSKYIREEFDNVLKDLTTVVPVNNSHRFFKAESEHSIDKDSTPPRDPELEMLH